MCMPNFNIQAPFVALHYLACHVNPRCISHTFSYACNLSIELVAPLKKSPQQQQPALKASPSPSVTRVLLDDLILPSKAA
jgi:hypothetical protein